LKKEKELQFQSVNFTGRTKATDFGSHGGLIGIFRKRFSGGMAATELSDLCIIRTGSGKSRNRH
jgi:hypothetical protein